MEEGSLKIVPASLPSISQPCHWDWAIWMGPCGGAVTRGYDGDITWVCILTASEGLEESHRDVLDINSFSLNVCCAPKCMLLTNVCDKWAYICVGERSHKRTRWSLSMHLYNWATTVSMQRHYAKIWPGGSLGAMLWGLVALVCARLRLSPHTHLCFIRGDSVRQGDCGRIHPPPEIMYKSVPQCNICTPLSLCFISSRSFVFCWTSKSFAQPATADTVCICLSYHRPHTHHLFFIQVMTDWFILNILVKNADEQWIPLCLNESRRTNVRQGYYTYQWTVQRPILLSRPNDLYLIMVDYITGIFSLCPKEQHN